MRILKMDLNYLPPFCVLNEKRIILRLPGFSNYDGSNIFVNFVDHRHIEGEAGRGEFTVGRLRI